MEKENLLTKICSIKFLVALATGLASFGAAIAGFCIQSEAIAITGTVCTAASGAIFSFTRSYTEGKALMANSDTTTTNKQVFATNTTAKTAEKLAGIGD